MKRVAIDAKYKPFVLKHYVHWTLLLNENQRYLGRAVVWLARPGEMQRFSQLTHAELLELQLVCREYEMVLDAVGWKPDHMNNLMLGNFVHEHEGHGHMHIIPRYAFRKIVFMGATFDDDRWGKNYAPATPFQTSADVLAGIVRVLKEGLLSLK